MSLEISNFNLENTAYVDNWEGVPLDECTPEQLQTRAIRLFLDKTARSHLPAIPNSFNSIANLRRFNLTWTIDNIDGLGIEGSYTDFNLKVVPDCINLLSGLRDLMLGYCCLNDDSIPDSLWQLTDLEKLDLSTDGNLITISSPIGLTTIPS